MKEKVFNRYVLIGVGIIVLFAIGVKIYTVFSFVEIHDWNYYQLQRIDKFKKNFSFVVFGDNRNSVKTFNNLLRKVDKENILFAIDGGDLVFNSSTERYNFFIRQIRKFHKPLLTVTGNHDIEGESTNYSELFGRFYYSFYVGNSYFIIFDDANEYKVDPWQMYWLRNELKRSQNYRYRFVFMHVPLYDPRAGQYKAGHSLLDLKIAKKLNDLFDRYHVTMVFASHIHGYFTGKWHKTPYIITGGAGAPLDGFDKAHYFYHYIKVKVSDNAVSYKVIKLPSPDFEILDRVAAYIWIYIYSFYDIHFWDSIIVLAIIYFLFYAVFYKKWIIFNLKKH